MTDRPAPAWRIEITGGIATGKSTLARSLGLGLGLPVSFERFEDNQFLPKFYADPERYAFEKNVAFLLIHAEAIAAAATSWPRFICDFALRQDLAYAALDRDPASFAAARDVLAVLEAKTAIPIRLNIRLVCSTATQLARIGARGRAFERGVDAAYLERLNAAIAQVADPPAATAATLPIDTDDVDIRDPAAAQRLVDRVRGLIAA